MNDRARRVTYERLSRTARPEILERGVTIAAFVRSWYPDGRWGGDRCGCPDDRCRGFHHEEHEECGCLPVVLAEMTGDPPGAT